MPLMNPSTTCRATSSRFPMRDSTTGSMNRAPGMEDVVGMYYLLVADPLSGIRDPPICDCQQPAASSQQPAASSQQQKRYIPDLGTGTASSSRSIRVSVVIPSD